MSSDIMKKTHRVDQAARLERLQSPQMIQKTKAIRFPLTFDIKIFKVKSEATGDGIYICCEQKLLSAEWADTSGDDKFGDSFSYTAWVTLTVYAADDYVSNNDLIYKCTVAHTAGDDDEEPGVGANWEDYWIEVSVEVLNLLEADPEAEYVAHLTMGDLIKAWQFPDDSSTKRWIGTPLRPDRRRIAFCKDDAGIGDTIDCYLDKDVTGTVITVHAAVSQGGGDLNDCGARLKQGDPLFVERIHDADGNNYWWCTGMPFIPGLYCTCGT